MTTTNTKMDPWIDVVGQEAVKAQLGLASKAPVHAYMFLGGGSTSFQVALGFAALLLEEQKKQASSEAADLERSFNLALSEKHPDLIVIEPEGSTIRVVEADAVAAASSRTPLESRRKVIVVKDIDLIEEAAAGRLLKVVEEPPPSTVFIMLASEVIPELVTIASRCSVVEFGSLSESEIASALVDSGCDEVSARRAAKASQGNLDRAKLLVTDTDLASRADLWAQLPQMLDGRGTTVVKLVEQVRTAIDAAHETLRTKQQSELEELEERVEKLGERGSGRSDLVAKHKREIRKQRTDELRFGLGILAGAYRDQAVEGSPEVRQKAFDSLAEIQLAAENLIRNPNEPLFLQSLFNELS